MSELPVVQEWQVVKVESLKKSPFSLLKQTFFRTFNFDGSSFLNHWEFRHVMYLILKVWSVVKWSQQLKGVAGLLPCVTPSWKKPFYSIKGLLYGFTCPSVYGVFQVLQMCSGFIVTSIFMCMCIRPPFIIFSAVPQFWKPSCGWWLLDPVVV